MITSKKKQIILQNIGRRWHFDALEGFGMVEKELHFPQVDIETVEGPIATIKTNHGDLRISSSLNMLLKQWLTLWLFQKMVTMMVSFSIVLSRTL